MCCASLTINRNNDQEKVSNILFENNILIRSNSGVANEFNMFFVSVGEKVCNKLKIEINTKI